MPWTTYQDVASRWVGAGLPTDQALVNSLIGDAEAIIVSEYPRIQERITANTLSVQIVKLVVSRMVSRMLRNPEGLSSVQQTTGPFSYSKSFTGGGSGSDIWLSAEEKSLLAPSRSGKAFEIDLGHAAYHVPDLYESDGVGTETWKPIGR